MNTVLVCTYLDNDSRNGKIMVFRNNGWRGCDRSETKMHYANKKLFVFGTEKVEELLFRQFLAAICFKVKYFMLSCLSVVLY